MLKEIIEMYIETDYTMSSLSYDNFLHIECSYLIGEFGLTNKLSVIKRNSIYKKIFTINDLYNQKGILVLDEYVVCLFSYMNKYLYEQQTINDFIDFFFIKFILKVVL